MYLQFSVDCIVFVRNQLVNQLLIIINWCCAQLAVLAVKRVRLQQHVQHVPLGIIRVHHQFAWVSDVYDIYCNLQGTVHYRTCSRLKKLWYSTLNWINCAIQYVATAVAIVRRDLRAHHARLATFLMEMVVV